jgi:hypothetical protein
MIKDAAMALNPEEWGRHETADDFDSSTSCRRAGWKQLAEQGRVASTGNYFYDSDALKERRC